MFNNNFNNGYYNPMYGTMYQQQIQPPKYTQGISEEQANMLKQNHEQFSLNVDPVEILKCRCTHKDPKTHDFTLDNHDDGTVQCRICGERFRLNLEQGEQIENSIQSVIDILQTDKTLYLDMPQTYAAEYFNMIAWLKKLSQLHNLSLTNFAKYEDAGLIRPTLPPQQNAIQFYNSFTNGGIMPNQYANPMMGQPYMGQPMMPQQGMVGQPYMGQMNVNQMGMNQTGYNPAMMNTMNNGVSNPFTSNGTLNQQGMMGQPMTQYNGYSNPVMPNGATMDIVQTTPAPAQATQQTTVNTTAVPTQPAQTTTTTVGNETQQSAIFNA